MLLKRVLAKRILDSRGEPTIEVHIRGCKASSPSGKSKGKYENIDFFRSIGFCVNIALFYSCNNWGSEFE